MRHGVRIGIDPGDARIGVARSDPTGFLATPVETVRRGKGDLSRLARLVRESEAVEVVVGLPRSLSGGEGPAAVKTREFAARLAAKKIPHELDVWGSDVPHDWPSWRAQLRHHLPRFC